MASVLLCLTCGSANPARRQTCSLCCASLSDTESNPSRVRAMRYDAAVPCIGGLPALRRPPPAPRLVPPSTYRDVAKPPSALHGRGEAHAEGTKTPAAALVARKEGVAPEKVTPDKGELPRAFAQSAPPPAKPPSPIPLSSSADTGAIPRRKARPSPAPRVENAVPLVADDVAAQRRLPPGGTTSARPGTKRKRPAEVPLPEVLPYDDVHAGEVDYGGMAAEGYTIGGTPPPPPSPPPASPPPPAVVKRAIVGSRGKPAEEEDPLDLVTVGEQRRAAQAARAAHSSGPSARPLPGARSKAGDAGDAKPHRPRPPQPPPTSSRAPEAEGAASASAAPSEDVLQLPTLSWRVVAPGSLRALVSDGTAPDLVTAARIVLAGALLASHARRERELLQQQPPAAPAATSLDVLRARCLGHARTISSGLRAALTAKGGFSVSTFEELVGHMVMVINDERTAAVCHAFVEGRRDLATFAPPMVALAKKRYAMNHAHQLQRRLQAAAATQAVKKQRVAPAPAAPRQRPSPSAALPPSSPPAAHKPSSHFPVRASRMSASLNEDAIAARLAGQASPPPLLSMSSRRARFAIRAFDSAKVQAWEPTGGAEIADGGEAELSDEGEAPAASLDGAATWEPDSGATGGEAAPPLRREDAAANPATKAVLLADLMADDDGDDGSAGVPVARSASAGLAAARGQAPPDTSAELPDFDASLWDDLMGELGESQAAACDIAAVRPGSVSPDIGLQDSDFHAFFDSAGGSTAL